MPPEDAPTEAAPGAVPRPRTPRPPPSGTPYDARPPAYAEPVPPGEPGWWERFGVASALAALAALAIGFVLGLLVGESSSSKTVTTGLGRAATVTVRGPTHTTTVTHVVTHTQTHTVTAATPTEGATGDGAGGAAKTYTGNGSGSLGTIIVSHQSTLRWRSSGEFSLKNSPEDEHSLAFSATASSGESPVEPGTYHQVTANASGPWSFTITPG